MDLLKHHKPVRRGVMSKYPKSIEDFTCIGKKKFYLLCEREDFLCVDYFYSLNDDTACAILKFETDNCSIDAFGKVKWGICV